MPLTMTSTAPTRDATTAGDAPAALPPSVIAALEARRRQASSDFEEALALGGRQQSRIDTERLAASRDLASEFTNQRMTAMRQLGSIGQARSPRFADRLRREALRMQTTQEGRMTREAALQMASVEEMMAAARRARDRQLLELESEEALARAQLERVFLPPSIGA